MGNIVLLDDLTINKIAAGEVIERPASVVKEVVENSIDAGADNISVEIRNGGISYIRITDNGKGIAADDLEIAFERHATSKIRKAEDLETVKSMGFRGEALASIAAIARVELVSKTADSAVGNKIVVEGGKIISKEEVGCPKGTTITIENLFFNTPVRYKFLKKDFTESGYIEDTITRIALVNPNIAIKYINTGKTVIQTSGNGDIRDIVYGIYGKDIAENIINVEYNFEEMTVKGVIGKPTIARSNRANQLFFVNKRYVKDKTLTSAAEQAFKGTLPIGKYGFLILNVEMDPHLLDVNVHPAKLEVRFQEENKVFKLIYHGIKESLIKANIINDSDSGSQGGLPGLNKTEKNDIFGTSKFDNKFDNKYESKFDTKQTDSKGLGGFLKNIIGKNEHTENEINVVESVYNDKILHEKQDLYKEKDEEKSESISDSVTQNENNTDLYTGIDYKFNAISVTPKLDFSTESNASEKNEKENYDNLIIGKDGKIQLAADKEEQHVRIIDDDKETNTETNIELDNKVEENFGLETATTNDKKSIDPQELADIESSKMTEAELKEAIKEATEVLEPTEVVESKEEAFQKEKEQDQLIETIEKVEQISENKIEDVKAPETVNENKKETSESSFEEMYAKMFGTNISKKKEELKEEKGGYKVQIEDFKPVQNISLFNDKNMFSGPVYKYIGIIFGLYIVIEFENEMYIIDQVAANERVLYEKVKTNYYSDTDKDAQLMLLPDIINLTPKEMGIAKDNLALFRKAGFDLEEFGENTIKLNGVPNICMDLDTRELFIETLEEVNTVARTAKQEVEEKFIETIAKKVATKCSIALTEPEVDSLMQRLLVLKNPFTCPNGNQVAIKMSKMDIEKKFSRR